MSQIETQEPAAVVARHQAASMASLPQAGVKGGPKDVFFVYMHEFCIICGQS